MTEAEWLTCDEPGVLFEALGRRVTDRKLRLFFCACCRSAWPRLRDTRSQQAVETAERFADGEATRGDLIEAERLALLASYESRGSDSAYHANMAYRATCQPPQVALYPKARVSGPAGYVVPAGVQVGLLRCLFGNPLRPHPPEQGRRAARVWRRAFDSWIGWNGGMVATLAQATYGERELPSGHLDPARLGVLADALEDAGCSETDILEHLRGGSRHVRGCWVLDLLLGKEWGA